MFSVYDLLLLSRVPGIGGNRLRVLVSHFGDPTEVLKAPAREIVTVEGFSKKLASTVAHFASGHRSIEAGNFAEQQLSRLNKVGGKILTYWDKRYPDLLRKIYDPPPFLFVRGDLTDHDRFSIAIVGTRSPSEYGLTMAARFTQELSKLGVTIVSGLARGVDTVVHAAALKSGARTLAIIGSGIDVCYPPENRDLFERIVRQGAICSEYEMGAKPDAVNFPKRNRIISGLCMGTLIIETDVNGGAMITANMALDQNREVFAVPGNISSRRSKGCNVLIKDGRAKLVESVEDIVQELSSKLRPLLKNSEKDMKAVIPEMTLFERKLFDILTDDAMHIDAIAERSGLTTSDSLVNLLSLEFKGLVKQLPGKVFVRL